MPGSPRAREHGVLPLRVGDRGDAVADLQQRLTELSLPVADEPGDYGDATAGAVRAFQLLRGLPDDGQCDRQTWGLLVEAGYRFGDRLLYRRTPMLRGDDVAELQRLLSALGFDVGRVDGIFGDQTGAALQEFQRNMGLLVDGVCGRRTIDELRRLQLRDGGSDLVSPLREALRLASHEAAGLRGRRVGVGERGGFAAGVGALCRSLRDAGALAHPLHHPDPSRQAFEANAAEVECFVSLCIRPEVEGCTTTYYRGYHYESVASRRLAELVQKELPGALGLADAGTVGMSLPILRETRMPAVEVQLGAPALVVQRTSDLARIVVDALAAWVTTNTN